MPTMQRPHIILLHSHDTGRYIQPYGYGLPTPNLQRFAEQGVVFRQAFCACPTCSPSRAALMTGRMPHQVGMFGLAHCGWSLDPDATTLVQRLREAGYHTALAGFQHIVPWQGNAWERIGYHERFETAGGTGEERAEAACAFLDQPHDRPFFLDLGFTETHRSAWVEHDGSRIQWHNGAESPTGDPRYVRPPITLPDDPITRHDFADFAESLYRLDRLYGRVLDQLESSGLADHTIVAITTDHGLAFPRMKCNLTDHGIGVMLMMRGPAAYGLRGGRVVQAMTSQTDLLPTLLDWLGLDPAPDAEGVSLRPVLENAEAADHDTALHDAVFAELSYHGKREIERAIRTDRFKYIRTYDDQPIDRHSCDGSTSRDHMTQLGWGTQPLRQERLYDLVMDPAEACDLSPDPAHQHTVKGLRELLESRMRCTNDPALTGSVPEPRRRARRTQA